MQEGQLEQSELNVLLKHRLITFASRMGKALAVLYRDASARISDKPGFVQNACCDRNRTATGAQHHRQKFVSYRYVIGLKPVRAHQQPASQTLFEFVDSIACGSLGGLRKITLDGQLHARA